MTPKQSRDYCKTIIEAAFDAIIAKEMNEQHEKQMQEWMHSLDQDEQAIEDFCNDR